MCWKKECPLGAQLRVTTRELRAIKIVVVGDLRVDWLLADLEYSSNAAANG